MNTQERKDYRSMIILSLLIILVCSILITLFTKSLLSGLSTIYGGFIGVLGFISIIYSVYHFEIDVKFQKRVLLIYMVRFILYFAFLAMGAIINLNLLSMLVGFISTSLAIKLYVVCTERGNSI